ncbi:Protein with RNI-like/FBD-like domains [Raphanus sativus]|nr:Protein with RNI-like/FBD-like domains [Raphanus sativus]
MSIEDLENADRISQLPEALILLILCLLPVKVAIATSLLSKQWKYLWKLMPKLKFDYLDHKRQLGTFSSNAVMTLLSHMAPVLQSLYLIVHLERCNAKDTGILLGIALGLHVHELVLEVRSREVFKFPSCLFNVNKLVTLKLRYKIHMDVPSPVCFKTLRNLHLHYVEYKDHNSVINLLDGCPNLKTLTVHRYSHSSVKTFTISVPALDRLSIYNSNGGQLDWGYVINTPSLKLLKIKGICGLGFCLIENVMELVEASIIDVSSISNENLLGSLASVKRLSLRISPLKRWHCEKDYVGRGEWKQPENLPKCFWFHLETFIWKGYKWQREDEKQVAKYVLENAINLKRAIFSSKRIKHKERVEVFKDLKSVARASNLCQIIFK